jgi:hypothetical protein
VSQTVPAPELASQLEGLAARGVTNPEQFASMPVEDISAVTQWFDKQKAHRPVGPGVLVAELRNGGRAALARRAATQTADQEAYAAAVDAWLRPKFPDLINSRGRVHCAAALAVYRLHSIHGKGTLTVAEHGCTIRAAVERWMSYWGQDLDGNEIAEVPA